MEITISLVDLVVICLTCLFLGGLFMDIIMSN